METAIIAGVGPGTGASLARAFAAERYAIALLSRHAASAEPVAQKIRADLGKSPSWFITPVVIAEARFSSSIRKAFASPLMSALWG